MDMNVDVDMARNTLFSTILGIIALSVLTTSCGPATGHPRKPVPENAPAQRFADVRFDQNLGYRIPMQLIFRNERGEPIELKTLFGARPVVLALVYYECPNLCTAVLNGLIDALAKVGLESGKQFDVIAVSINPAEKPALAAKKLQTYLERYRAELTGSRDKSQAPANIAAGWHFLTGEEDQIEALADVAGFHYIYDQKNKQFVHPAGFLITTPEGKISKYLYGIRFAERDLRLALIEASGKKIGTVADQLLLLCYHYDSKEGRYSFAVFQLIRWATLLVIAVLVTFWAAAAFRHKRFKGLPMLLLGLLSLPGQNSRADSLWIGSASTISSEVDTIFYLLVGASAFLLLGVAATIVIFVARYRASRVQKRAQPKANQLTVELSWTIIPFFLYLGLFIWAAITYYKMNAVPAAAIDVYVTAKQWMWKFQHPNGFREINELHVPIDKPVKLIMTSEDVIHSLFVPAFRIKHDVLPGRYAVTWFQATVPGEYDIACTQYCGTYHAKMRGKVIALGPDAYARWLKATVPGQIPTVKPQLSLASGGRELFNTLGCTACHGLDAAGTKLAPKLQGVFGSTFPLTDGTSVTADETYIRESILDPGAKIVQSFQPIMPSFRDRVSEEQLQQLVAFIKALKYGERSGP